MPRGLVELIESRFGALSQPVVEVIDALAVGEPLEMTTLREDCGPRSHRGRQSARPESRSTKAMPASRCDLAHPLYGEVRRSRSAETRLRRLRGRVGDRAGVSPGRRRHTQRGAPREHDSRLRPDARPRSAPDRGTWCDLAWRLAAGGSACEAAIRARPRRHARISFVRMRCPGCPQARKPTRWSGRSARFRAHRRRPAAGSRTSAPSTCCGALGDAPRAKGKSSTRAASSTVPRFWIDASLAVYWCWCTGSAAGSTKSIGKKPCAGRLASGRGR